MRVAAEVALWWTASTAAYLLLVTSPTGIEAPVGVVIGGVCALVGVASRRAFRPVTQVPAFVRRAVWLPVDLAADAVTLPRMLLTGEAFRADAGEEDEVVLPDDDGARVWAVLVTSASPGSVAVDLEERDDSLVLRRHRVTAHHRASDEWRVG